MDIGRTMTLFGGDSGGNSAGQSADCLSVFRQEELDGENMQGRQADGELWLRRSWAQKLCESVSILHKKRDSADSDPAKTKTGQQAAVGPFDAATNGKEQLPHIRKEQCIGTPLDCRSRKSFVLSRLFYFFSVPAGPISRYRVAQPQGVFAAPSAQSSLITSRVSWAKTEGRGRQIIRGQLLSRGFGKVRTVSRVWRVC